MIQLNLSPPAIEKFLPRQSGQDNEGVGYTRHGERYLLKTAADVCVAEVLGSILCRACGIPVPEQVIVDFRGRLIFGSRLESGVYLPKNNNDLMYMVEKCGNSTIFSAVLAIDLALGNNDRHWHNWLPQEQDDGRILLRAVDFSRAWPTTHPVRPCESMRGSNTHLVWKEWKPLGVIFDPKSAFDVCDKIEGLSDIWLSDIFSQLPVEWMVSASGPELCQWWKVYWPDKVEEVRKFLKSGAWT